MPQYDRYQELSRYDEKFGTLTTLGDTVSIPCTGTASAVISIKGTFTGKITVYGTAADSVSAEGGRLAFLSGVGSLGTNVLANNGRVWDKEFRCVTGGSFLRIEATEWSSGSAEISISVSNAPSIVFINGPVHSAEEEAVRGGRAFLTGLASVALTSSQDLHLILRNPNTSTSSMYLTERLFSSISQEPLEYIASTNPTNVLTQTGITGNRKFGGPDSAVEFTYQVATAGAIVLNGGAGSSEPIPSDGTVRERKFLFVIPPNTALGFTIRGAGNNLAQSSRVWSTFQWFEEDLVI